jgi:hypothetical protein
MDEVYTLSMEGDATWTSVYRLEMPQLAGSVKTSSSSSSSSSSSGTTVLVKDLARLTPEVS